jgi:hypothetical protein
MEKVIQIFQNFAEAEAADVHEDLSMTPEQRIELVLQLQDRMYPGAAQQGFARVYRITELEQG